MPDTWATRPTRRRIRAAASSKASALCSSSRTRSSAGPRSRNRDYLVRQLNDHKASIEVGDLKAGGLLEYAAVCGEMLARGHARSGDSAVLAGYLGNSERFDEAIVAFAEAYADQTELDWKQLVHSLRAKPKGNAEPKAKSQSK